MHMTDLAFHDLQSQSRRCMKGDMAMHKPRAWIIRLKGNNNKASTW